MLTGKKLGLAIREAIELKLAAGGAKTKKEIADHFGVKPPSLHDWIERGTIGKDKLIEMFGYFSDVVEPSHWGLSNSFQVASLEIEEGTEQRQKKLSANLKNNDKTEIHLEQFDTGGDMGHGVILRDQPGVIQSWNVSVEWLNKNVRAHSGAKNLCIVTGFGDSMRPMFNPGDPLIVDRGVKSVEFDAIYFFRVGEEGFIKRLQRIPGEGLRVISTNKEYESWTVRSDMDFEVFGRVLKVWCSEDF